MKLVAIAMLLLSGCARAEAHPHEETFAVYSATRISDRKTCMLMWSCTETECRMLPPERWVCK